MKSIKKNLLIIIASAQILFFAPVSHGRPESKWDNSLELRVIRCFKMKNVKIRCDRYVIPDTGGKISAELEILATDFNGKKFAYGYGKSIEGGLCREHLTKIQALIRNQDQVCVGGDGEYVLDDGETYARWRELETRIGKVIW
jgi:hypothetical protein